MHRMPCKHFFQFCIARSYFHTRFCKQLSSFLRRLRPHAMFQGSSTSRGHFSGTASTPIILVPKRRRRNTKCLTTAAEPSLPIPRSTTSAEGLRPLPREESRARPVRYTSDSSSCSPGPTQRIIQIRNATGLVRQEKPIERQEPLPNGKKQRLAKIHPWSRPPEQDRSSADPPLKEEPSPSDDSSSSGESRTQRVVKIQRSRPLTRYSSSPGSPRMESETAESPDVQMEPRTRRRSRPLSPERPHGPREPQRPVTLVPWRAAQRGMVQLRPALSDVNRIPLGTASWAWKKPEPAEQLGRPIVALTPQWGAAAAKAGTTAIPAATEARKLKRKVRNGHDREKVWLAPSCGSDGRCRFEVARKGKRFFRKMYLSRSL